MSNKISINFWLLRVYYIVRFKHCAENRVVMIMPHWQVGRNLEVVE